MARFTGPRRKRVRRLGTELPGLTQHTAEERPQPPGEPGDRRARRRRRVSDYGVRLAEKQKIRFNYGLTESQLRSYVRKASRARGATGEALFRLLEARLDNVVFRLGLAPTIPAARQLVRHRHVFLNGKRVDMPGHEVAPGDRVEVRPESRGHPHVAEGAERGPILALPSYLERAADGFGGTCKSEPARDDVPIDVDDRLVIEYYAR